MGRKSFLSEKNKPARYEGDDTEGHEDNKDDSTIHDQPIEGETKEGETIALPKTRERRKAPSVEEMGKMARLMSYEDRTAVIHTIREDMRKDVLQEQQAQELALAAQQEKLDRLKNLGGI